MSEMNATVYQSGEKVQAEGWYEVVGGTSRLTEGKRNRAIIQLTANQVFPNYDGRAICWRQLGNSPISLQMSSPVLQA